jgi:hypothetical protein
MPVWKVLLVGLFAVVCMSLATAAIIVPFGFEGNERWLWLGGLILATLVVGVLFALFLRHASSSLDAKPGGSRR